MDARLADGALHEEIDVDRVGPLAVRYERCPAGWSVAFTVTNPEVADLGVVHRLVAPTLKDARRAVPQAIAFLLGHPVDPPYLSF